MEEFHYDKDGNFIGKTTDKPVMNPKVASVTAIAFIVFCVIVALFGGCCCCLGGLGG